MVRTVLSCLESFGESVDESVDESLLRALRAGQAIDLEAQGLKSVSDSELHGELVIRDFMNEVAVEVDIDEVSGRH